MLAEGALAVRQATHQARIRLCPGGGNQSHDLQELGKRPRFRWLLTMIKVKDKERPRASKSVKIADDDGSLVVLVVVRGELVESLKDLIRLGLIVDADATPDLIDGICLGGELCDDT